VFSHQAERAVPFLKWREAVNHCGILRRFSPVYWYFTTGAWLSVAK